MLTRDEFIEKFRFLKKWRYSNKKAITALKDQYDDGLDYNELLAIAKTPSQEQVQKVVDKYSLVCPRCGTAEFIVGESMGEEVRHKISHTIEYYCNNKTPDDVTFSKCFYHFKLERPHTRKVKECTV